MERLSESDSEDDLNASEVDPAPSKSRNPSQPPPASSGAPSKSASKRPMEPTNVTSGAAKRVALLSEGHGASVGEKYMDGEACLNKYARLHPMINYEATNSDALAALTSKASGRVMTSLPELPLVSKSYEDTFLRPARLGNGERSCVLGDQCLCNFIALLRHGPNNKKGFVGVEFMLPEQRDKWQSGEGLPAIHGKCLVCIRYFTTYVYMLAASDPTYMESLRAGRLRLQTHANMSLSYDEKSGHLLCGDQPTPGHVNAVSTVDGYLPSALLSVDPKFADRRAGRETQLSELVWKPFVRFQSTHYRYITDHDTDEKRMVQVGIGCDAFVGGSASTLDSDSAHLNEPPPYA